MHVLPVGNIQKKLSYALQLHKTATALYQRALLKGWDRTGYMEKPDFKQSGFDEWLQNRGNMKYQRRYFMLDGTMLYYYKNAGDTYDVKQASSKTSSATWKHSGWLTTAPECDPAESTTWYPRFYILTRTAIYQMANQGSSMVSIWHDIYIYYIYDKIFFDRLFVLSGLRFLYCL
jgi:hypothetical protein